MMNRNNVQRDRRQKELRQKEEIETLQLQLKVLRQNYQKCVKSKEQLQELNTLLMFQIKEKGSNEVSTRQVMKREVEELFRDKIREAELRSIRVEEEYQKEIEGLEQKFRQDLEVQFEREEGLNKVIEEREKRIGELEDEVFELGEVVRGKDAKIQELSFVNCEYEGIVKSLRQENSHVSLEIKRYDGEIQLLNLEITRLQDRISERDIQINQLHQQTFNRNNELKYVSEICGENNEIKHILLNENDSLLGVANMMNRDILDGRMRQYQMGRELVERTEELNRKHLQMNSLKYQISELPLRI